MLEIDKILVDVLPLHNSDKLQLVDKILASMQPINNGVDKVWENESEERITAYNEGRVSSIDEDEILKKYSK